MGVKKENNVKKTITRPAYVTNLLMTSKLPLLLLQGCKNRRYFPAALPPAWFLVRDQEAGFHLESHLAGVTSGLCIETWAIRMGLIS